MKLSAAELAKWTGPPGFKESAAAAAGLGECEVTADEINAEFEIGKYRVPLADLVWETTFDMKKGNAYTVTGPYPWDIGYHNDLINVDFHAFSICKSSRAACRWPPTPWSSSSRSGAM